MPRTFVIDLNDKEDAFEDFVYQNTEKNLDCVEECPEEHIKSGNEFIWDKKLNNTWIVKPGENTNQGYGIYVTTSLFDMKQSLQES
jgi:hypothetical protein